MDRAWSPYNYARNNPIRFIDPDGMFFDEYYDKFGKKLGEDEKGKNGIIRFVDDKKEIKLISENTKKGDITQSSLISSGFSTTKTIIGEALNVLDRTVGLGEQGSTVTKDGVITRMTPGSAEPEDVDGVKISSIDFTIPRGDENTSIHSHIIDVFKTTNGNESMMRATKIGPNDPNLFKHFQQNIIVGNLGLRTADGEKWIMPPTGAVFYDRLGTKIGDFTKAILQKIMKP